MTSMILPSHRRNAGFTLIELMVAMLLGLIVIAGVSSVFLANLRSYRSNTALSEVQSNARIAFELMARDIRQAGLSGCNAQNPKITNVYVGDANWWPRWSQPLTGYTASMDDAVASDRVEGTDSLRITGTEGIGDTIDPDAAIGSGGSPDSFKITAADPLLKAGSLVMVCNPVNTAIFQVTGTDGVTVEHEDKDTADTGNAGVNLGSAYGAASPAQLYRLTANDWYVGPYTNSDGDVMGSSLYRVSLQSDGSFQTDEMVRNVTGMTISYHVAGDSDYKSASTTTKWAMVDAVRVTLTLQSGNQRAGTDAQPIERTFTSTTTLRNRVN